MTAAIHSDATKRVEIDFMYLDLETCTRCKGTDANLTIALKSVGKVLEDAGAEVMVKKTLIDSEQKALHLGFASSPTIRVNGRDIALEFRESSCASCGETCGCDGQINCRVWVYRGEEHTVAPVPMIVDAILSAVYSPTEGVPTQPSQKSKALPENLQRFFRGKSLKEQLCCEPAEQATCCDSTKKAECCPPASDGCACR